MGYRGKLQERARARELRAEGWAMPDIAEQLSVSKSSVSLWTRDVAFTPNRRRTDGRRREARHRGPNALQQRKQAQIEEFLAAGITHIDILSEREFLVTGVMLYAGEGAKTDGMVSLANTNADFIKLFCAWLRHFFDVDETRLRVKLYLHQGLDLEAATTHWSAVTGVPPNQFGKPYRAVPDAGVRNSKHVYGCATVSYCCSRTHREIMGLVHALVAGPGWVSGTC